MLAGCGGASPWSVTSHLPSPGTYALNGPNGEVDSEFGSAPGDTVSVASYGEGGEAADSTFTYDSEGLYLTSLTGGSSLDCAPNVLPLMEPSRLSAGKTWRGSFPCTQTLASGPAAQTDVYTVTISGRSSLTITGVHIPVVIITRSDVTEDASGQLLETETTTDSLDPRSGLTIRQVSKYSGSLTGSSVEEFQQVPTAIGPPFG